MNPQKLQSCIKYRANFLWPYGKGSIEEAGYEFANARTERYRKKWWKILVKRIEEFARQHPGASVRFAGKSVDWMET